jgi:hypothetical protein
MAPPSQVLEPPAIPGRFSISHHEPILTAKAKLYNGHQQLTPAELLACVEWICTDTADWIRSKFRFADAERILDEVKAMGVIL